MNEAIDMEEFRITPEKLAELQNLQAAKPSPSKPKRGMFYKFHEALVDALVQTDYAPAYRLAFAIYRTHFKDWKNRNPVTLTSTHLAEFRISKDQKSTGLKILEQSGLFLVERSKGRNPRITMTWLPVKKD